MVKVGQLVEFEDIGTPARCVAVGKHEAQFELDGEVFWVSFRLLRRIARGGKI